jgi:hypothetical protein
MGTSVWLKETVESIAQFQHVCAHVLVAPRASVRELAARFPNTQVIAEPGGGMYAAINSAAAIRRDWDAITYINDDDLLLPGFELALQRLSRLPIGCRIVYGRVRLIDGDGIRIGRVPVSGWPSLNRSLYAQRLEPVFQHGTLISRAAWRELGGFDATFRFCGDSELMARACAQGVSFVHVPAEIAAFRLRAGQLTKNRAAMLAERDRVDVKLGLRGVPGWWRCHSAMAVFRISNIPVYLDRIRRYGFITFDDMLTRVGSGS